MREVHPHICTTWEPLAFSARSPTSVAVCQKFAAENGAVKSEIRSPRVSCCTAATPAYIRVRPLEGRDRYTSEGVSTLTGDITLGTYDSAVWAIISGTSKNILPQQQLQFKDDRDMFRIEGIAGGRVMRIVPRPSSK